MDIQFDGFQNAVPVFWIVILIAGALILSYWTYQRASGLSAAWRWVLTGLRSVAFLILLLILLNPVISINEERTSPLHLALLLDNSQSTAIDKGSYQGESRYRDVMRILTPDATGNLEHVVIETYGFDAELFPVSSTDELALDGTRTNIDRGLTDFLDKLDQHEALILVTDGIVTSGRDPSATASQMPIPIYTVAIGDTSRQNDIVVQRVTHNPTASLNSSLTVEASILNDGFPDRDILVQLRHEDQVMEEQTIRSSEMRSVQQVRFEIMLDEEGLQQFQIHVPEVPGEWTTENNTRWFSVDVRDDRLRILHLAYEVHPDVRNVRRFLREDKQVTLENRTWITGERYVEGELPDRPDTLDLVILHGFPHVDLGETHAREVADRFSENALFFIGSAGQDVSRLSRLFSGQLPIRFQSGYRWQDVQFHLPAERSSHAVLDFEMPDDLRLTPIRGGIRDAGATANASALLRTTYRGNETQTPLLAVQTIGDRNISQLNAYNMYLWSLSTRRETRDFWEDLLNNIIKWTAAQPDEELLNITPAEPVVQLGEPVILNGFLRNEAGDPEENAVIDLVLDSDDIDERRYVMSNETGGRYQLEIGNLSEGSYRFTGTANRGDREIDTRTGQFTVGGINREFLDTVRDDDLLRFIAQVSDGRFLPHDQAETLFDILEEEIGFDQRIETTSETLSLHRNPLWFILVILLLTAEWGIRKYRSLH